MKILGIVLIILQLVGIFGAISGGEFGYILTRGVPYLFGYFLPAIIGIILLVKAPKKDKKDESEN